MSFFSNTRNAFSKQDYGYDEYDGYDEYGDEYDGYDDEFADEEPEKKSFKSLFSKFRRKRRDDTYEDEEEYAEQDSDYGDSRRSDSSDYSSKYYGTSSSDYSRKYYGDYSSKSSYSSDRSSDRTSGRTSSRSASRSSIRYNSKNADIEVKMMHPKNFNSSVDIINEVKAGKIVVFQTADIPKDEARRLVDFVCGAAEGMECPCRRLCKDVFCMTPKAVRLNVPEGRFTDDGAR